MRFNRAQPWRPRRPSFGPYPGARRRGRPAGDQNEMPFDAGAADALAAAADVVTASAFTVAPDITPGAADAAAASNRDVLIAFSPSRETAAGSALAVRQSDALANIPGALIEERQRADAAAGCRRQSA